MEFGFSAFRADLLKIMGMVPLGGGVDRWPAKSHWQEAEAQAA